MLIKVTRRSKSWNPFISNDELTRVVEMTPVRVVEITPERLPVVEITPVFVVEITPALVVEMTPVFANVVTDRAVTKNAAQIATLRFFIVLLLVIRNQG